MKNSFDKHRRVTPVKSQHKQRVRLGSDELSGSSRLVPARLTECTQPLEEDTLLRAYHEGHEVRSVSCWDWSSLAYFVIKPQCYAFTELFSTDHTHRYSKITSWVLFLILNRKRSPPGTHREQSHLWKSEKDSSYIPCSSKKQSCPRTDLLLFFFSDLWCSLPTFQEKLLLPNGNFISTCERT